MTIHLGKIGSRANRPVSFIGKVFTSLFLSVFFLAGLFFLVMMGKEILRTAESYRWAATPCVIESCSITNSGSEYAIAVAYRYEYGGRRYRSEQFALQQKRFADFGEAQRTADALPVGATRQCYVNPSNPAVAILRHGDLWLALFLCLPLVFMLVGAGGICAVWRKTPEAVTDAPATPPVWGRWAAGLFFSVFFLVGAGTFYSFGLKPALKTLDARQWPATPCVVVSSQVKSYSDSDGTTYSVDILYRYEVNGREYRSNRRTFFGGSSSGYEGKAKIVALFPPGTKAVCFVNPNDPTDAVLERGFEPTMLLGLLPLIFLAVGAGGLIWVFQTKAFRKPAGGVPAWQQNPEWAAGRIGSSNKVGMWVMWGVAAFWNSISWFFAVMVFSEHKQPSPSWFVLIFPMVGLFLIWQAIRQTRQWMKYGESYLELTDGPGVIGGTLAGRIQLSRFMRVEDGFRMRLSCMGIDSSGDSSSESALWQKEMPSAAGGTETIPVAFHIPAERQETMSQQNYRIAWRLTATGQLDGAKYEAKFEVPVIRAELTAEQEAAAKQLQAREEAVTAGYQPPRDSKILVQTSARGGKEFFFPAARNKGVAVFWTMFLVIWTAALWFMVTHRAPIGFPIVFGFFDVLLVYAVLVSWFGTTRVTVEGGAITVQKRIAGIGRTRTVACAEVEKIAAKVGGQSGSITYQDIKIHLRNGKSMTAGSAIKDFAEAEWIAAGMAKAAGVSGKSTDATS
jgi:hypothetical protein